MGRARELLQHPGAVALGGGTDLLVSIREGIAAPDVLVDLRFIQAFTTVDWLSDGSVSIGAGARIAQLASDPVLRERLTALAEACEAVGTPALRHMGTLGGNLCQRPRCWYFRAAIPCLKNGGTSCPAAQGENQHHAVLGGGPCFIVHPSDPAVALTALEATVQIDGPAGARTLALSDFYVLPSDRLDGETVLAPGEFLTRIHVPGTSVGGPQRYLKLMQRGAWDFALASVAVMKRRDGAVRLVLGGVAPKPWRVTESVEEDVASGSLTADDIETLAERALYDAKPLSKNGYKVDLAKTLLRRAIAFISPD